MAADRRDANMKVLADADEIQQKTKDTVFRIKQQAAETEALGATTLEELRKQGQQMDDVNSELESVNNKLDQSQALQSRFDRWAGNWFGGKKNAALKEAQEEIAEAQKQEHSKVKEVFQHEKYEVISRTWKSKGFVLCNQPSVAAPDIFDPNSQDKDSNWKIDYSLVGIDPEGWTYASDFEQLNKTPVGDPAPKWNSYVRRRKWKFEDKKAGGLSEGLEAVKERHNANKAKMQGGGSSQAEKIGYVPRNKISLTESGRSSATMNKGKKEDDLDEDSRRGLAKIKQQDAEIDEGIDEIAKQLDNLGNIASSMNEEVKNQNVKLDKMESTMQKVSEKQTVVNARQRYLLK